MSSISHVTNFLIGYVQVPSQFSGRNVRKELFSMIRFVFSFEMSCRLTKIKGISRIIVQKIAHKLGIRTKSCIVKFRYLPPIKKCFYTQENIPTYQEKKLFSTVK